MKTIDFTEEKLNEFKLEYEKAVKAGKHIFKFHDEEYVTLYAKYVIEYLTDKFNKK